MKFKQPSLTQLFKPLFLIVVLISASALPNKGIAEEGWLRIHFIDVGYGDAILIQFPDQQTIMIDAGDKEYSQKLIDYLKSINIQEIDQAIISHPHANHFEGYFEVIKTIPIKLLSINGDNRSEEGHEKLMQIFRDQQIPVKKLERGMTVYNPSQSVALDVLHPLELSSNVNGNSIVLWLKYREISILLMADVGPEEQDQIMGMYQDLAQADIIKVPHHGGPLSDEFIRFFQDKSFIISTGENPWGLPREVDLQKLQGNVYRTDVHGTIVLESDGFSTSILPSVD